MAKKLTDPNKVKKVVDEFCKLEKPTFSKLLMELGIAQRSYYNYLDKNDEISDHLMRASLYMVNKHEEGLYDKNVAGHIFFLKCFKKVITFRENDTILEGTGEIKVTANVIRKEK